MCDRVLKPFKCADRCFVVPNTTGLEIQLNETAFAKNRRFGKKHRLERMVDANGNVGFQ